MPFVYLPIEIKTREWAVRCQLAKILQAKGFTVVIGQQWSLLANVKNIPPGVVLFKTMNAIQGAGMRDYKKAGFTVVAMDEEALLCADDACLRANVSDLAVSRCDVFLAQHEDHGRVMREMGAETVVVGNPRVDLCRGDTYKAEGDKIRAEYGPFILFNTNFGTVNSAWGGLSGAASLAKQAGLLETLEQRKAFGASIQWERENIATTIHLLNWAAEHAGKRVVIRPHPAEDLNEWKNLAGDKVTIIADTDPLPWMWAADLVVHTNSTTGLEAILMGKPVLNLETRPDPSCARLTSTLNTVARSHTEAVEAIQSGVCYQEAHHNKASVMFPNGANETIAKVIEERGFESRSQFTYERIPRAARQVAKCSIHIGEAGRALWPVQELDHSLFMVVPEIPNEN